MRKIFCLLLIFAALTCQAQDSNNENHDYYCEIYVNYLREVSISIPSERYSKSLVNKDGELIEFNNVPHVLVFMSGLGWNIAYLTEYESANTSLYFVKKAKTEDEAFEGLYFGEYPYKKKKK